MASLNIKLTGTNTFSIEGELTRNSVVNAWPTRHTQWAQLDHEVIFDLGSVSGLDTAGLAWLIMLSNELQRAKKQLTMQKAPDSLLKLAKISDVEGLLSLQ